LYADDTQIYGFCRPGATRSLESRMSDCFSAVADWVSSNRLQLNAAKTEILWCTSCRRQHQLPTSQLTVGNDQLTSVTSVRNLGIYVDVDLSMRTHVIRTAAGCFAVLRRIRSIWRSVTQPVLQSLVVSLVLSCLDYGSTVLFGLPQLLVDKLQSVQNAAARLVLAGRRRDHISPLPQGLHWLRVVERITFRLAVLNLPLPPPFSTRVPIQATAASLWSLYPSVTSLFVVHCTSHFTDGSSHHRRQSFLCCRDFSLEQPPGSSPFFSISGLVPKVTENGTIRAILFRLTY